MRFRSLKKKLKKLKYEVWNFKNYHRASRKPEWKQLKLFITLGIHKMWIGFVNADDYYLNGDIIRINHTDKHLVFYPLQ